MNNVDNMSQILVCIAASGLYYPMAAAIWGFVHAVGMLLYAQGYARGGPTARAFGGIILLPTRIAFPIFTIVSLAKLAGTGKLLGF